MKPTQKLHHDGQSRWLDNITRDLLTSGTLRQYIDELGITGLTSNPTIFDNAFLTTDAYDDAIVDAAGKGLDEEAIFAGVPINVTLLFSREQYLAAADAYMRGIERRIDADLDPFVGSVASVFVSRWDTAHEATEQPDKLQNMLGIAMAKRTYKAYRQVLDSDRWKRLANEGARPQRLLWASTGTKDPEASDVLYVRALAAPLTVNTMPEKTLLAFGDHGMVDEFLPADGGNAEQVISRFVAAGVDDDALAARLQKEAADSFVKSWDELIENIGQKSSSLMAAR